MRMLVLLFLCFSLTGWAQEYSSIKGKVKCENLKEVKLFQAVDGRIALQATVKVAPDGSFGFLLKPPTTGFYCIGTERMNFPIYLQGGEEVNINLLDKKAELEGKNSKENEALYIWQDYAAGIRLKSVFFHKTHSTYEDFFPEFESFIKGLDEVKKKARSGNRGFDELLQMCIDYDVDYYAIKFVQTPRSKHAEQSLWPEYYRHIVSDAKFRDEDILLFPAGVDMMRSYALFAERYLNMQRKDISHVENTLAFFHTDRLKGEFLLDREFGNYKSYDQYLAGMEKYGRFFTPAQKERAEVVGTKLYDTKPGNKAADFTYPDVNGKMVSLSDFKGKVVLVDVWATWCGPCRGEIPHLKRLEEEMHGKDVVFLGVSVDEVKNKQKWIDFIEKEGLKGIQLLAGGWSKITKDYKISGIPRFMVFDKEGNIVSVDAPRPSNPALKKMLEAELEK